MTFTASNGLTVQTDNDYDLCVEGDWVASAEGVEALREFFQHEKDEQLGRWRWPENPDYVVYPDGTSRRVVNESNGASLSVSVHDRKVMETYLDSYVGAARAYDEAHPEPKPWHDAKPGEMWVLTYGGEEVPAVVSSSESGHFLFTAATNDGGGTEELAVTSPSVTAARRIWPEADSE